ncbi:O-antigen ligase family protein [Flavobacterium phycosphaerae]|uniref:O-antigen ligase family protein n=1 Tax=Flavobacterium phycosphaerae TaxID=2697515 RepID=UPI00138A3A8B|nr:O-antigen ligase family protein [Flavobacterium phycosphaerae]
MNEKQQINLTLLHIAIGALLVFNHQWSKGYLFLIVLAGAYLVIKNKNSNNEVLYVIAYIAGSEVFFRATNGNPVHEFGKYSMLFFTFLGFYYSGFPKIKNPYWIYLVLLLPSVFLSFMYLDGNLRRKICFEILGPICMGFLALYTYKRKISAAQINMVLNLIALPILTSCIYLILKYPQNGHKIYSHNSNFYFSGNYAPNQMATVLGLGMFIYLLKIVIESDNRKILYPNIIIFCLIFHRGLLTFSRGGIVTGVIVALIFFLALYISRNGYYNLKRKVSLLLFAVISIFGLTSYQTDNSLFKRYADLEILESHKVTTRGRYIEIKSDIENFTEKPIIGTGPGISREVRKSNYGRDITTHNEITRLLSEHGVLGLLALLILIFFPLRFYYNDLRNFYLLPFFIFWVLTINHSATRTIAPLFLYALTLLQINFEKKEVGVDGK